MVLCTVTVVLEKSALYGLCQLRVLPVWRCQCQLRVERGSALTAPATPLDESECRSFWLRPRSSSCRLPDFSAVLVGRFSRMDEMDGHLACGSRTGRSKSIRYARIQRRFSRLCGRGGAYMAELGLRRCMSGDSVACWPMRVRVIWPHRRRLSSIEDLRPSRNLHIPRAGRSEASGSRHGFCWVQSALVGRERPTQIC